jgi:hypothetical protein
MRATWPAHLILFDLLFYSSPLCCNYILMDWITVKTQLSYCSISYLFVAFVDLVAFIAVLVQHKNSNESNETNERYK